MSQLFILRQIIQRKNPLLCNAWKYDCRKLSGKKITIKQNDYQHSSGVAPVNSLGVRLKENTKTLSYTAIIMGGVCVTAVVLWTIFKELFSSSSPNNVYSQALKLVKDDYRVQDAIGTPIKGYGEESRRRRRQHVAHTSYYRDDVLHIRMQFHIQGLRNKATVHLEARENSFGKMEYRYLYVQLDYYPHTVIVLEDNRSTDTTVDANHVNAPSVLPSSVSGKELRHIEI